MAENLSSPWRHSACFFTDVLSCDTIFLPQWDPDKILVRDFDLWQLCWPWRKRQVAGMFSAVNKSVLTGSLENEGTAAGWVSFSLLLRQWGMKFQKSLLFSNLDELVILSKRHSSLLFRFEMEDLMSSGDWPALMKGRRNNSEDKASRTEQDINSD